MLTCLTRRLRFRAAAILAAAYALCMVAPSVALAFTDGKAAAHCLSENHHLSAAVHVHADGIQHVHVKPDDEASGHAAHAHHDAAKPHDHAMHEHANGMAMHDPAMHDHATVALDHPLVADQAQADPQADPRNSGKSSGGTCCGLFCLNAAAFEMTPSIGVAPRGSLLQPVLQAHVVGHEPARIDRPPILVLSF